MTFWPPTLTLRGVMSPSTLPAVKAYGTVSSGWRGDSSASSSTEMPR
jgi:hypothetical protein